MISVERGIETSLHRNNDKLEAAQKGFVMATVLVYQAYHSFTCLISSLKVRCDDRELSSLVTFSS